MYGLKTGFIQVKPNNIYKLEFQGVALTEKGITPMKKSEFSVNMPIYIVICYQLKTFVKFC